MAVPRFRDIDSSKLDTSGERSPGEPPKAQAVVATALNAQAKGLMTTGRKAGVPHWRETTPAGGPPKEQVRHRPRESLR